MGQGRHFGADRGRQKLFDELAGGGIVQSYDTIETGASNILAVGTECNRIHGPMLACQFGDLLAIGNLIDPNSPLFFEGVGSDDALAVFAKASTADATWKNGEGS